MQVLRQQTHKIMKLPFLDSHDSLKGVCWKFGKVESNDNCNRSLLVELNINTAYRWLFVIQSFITISPAKICSIASGEIGFTAASIHRRLAKQEI